MRYGLRHAAAGLALGVCLAGTAACGGQTGSDAAGQPKGSPSASQQPSTQAPALAGGEVVGGKGEGFELKLAKSFETIKLGKEGKQAIKKSLGEMVQDPALERRLDKLMPRLLSETMRLYAVAPSSVRSSSSDFATNVNVTRSPAQFTSVDQLRPKAKATMQRMGATQVQASTVKLDGTKTVKLTYLLDTGKGTINGTQYYLLDRAAGKVFVVTFSTDQPGEYADVFAAMARTFHLV